MQCTQEHRRVITYEYFPDSEDSHIDITRVSHWCLIDVDERDFAIWVAAYNMQN